MPLLIRNYSVYVCIFEKNCLNRDVAQRYYARCMHSATSRVNLLLLALSIVYCILDWFEEGRLGIRRFYIEFKGLWKTTFRELLSPGFQWYERVCANLIQFISIQGAMSSKLAIYQGGDRLSQCEGRTATATGAEVDYALRWSEVRRQIRRRRTGRDDNGTSHFVWRCVG